MPGTFSAALVLKLKKNNRLDQDDVLAIEQVPIKTECIAAHHYLVREGDRPSESCLIMEGFAFRSKLTPDGNRQIFSIDVPGDIPDLQSLHLHVMDHDLTTLSNCTVGFIPHDALRELIRQRPNVSAALWRETLIDAAIFREWIVNVGCRPALPRMAHLLAEIHARLEMIGQTANGSFELPITQVELADCLGLSIVHVNRTLQQLRHEGLVATERKNYHLLEKERLEELGQFDPVYLHRNPSL
jgi:CRP-like cAMP-binding protein